MKRTLLSLFLFAVALITSGSSAGAHPPAPVSNSTTRSAPSAQTVKLRAHIQKTDRPSRNWMQCSDAQIKSSFLRCCMIGSAENIDDYDLHLEQPKEILRQFNHPVEDYEVLDCYKHEPAAGSRPEKMNFCTLHRWRYHLRYALHQLMWELGTDPAQGVRKLGRYYGGEDQSSPVPWSDSPRLRQYMDIDYRGKTSKQTGISSVPALGYRTNFSGTAKILLVFSRNRKVDARIVQSTLPDAVNHRIIESLKSLNGHPVSEFPPNKTDLDQIPFVCNMDFTHGPRLQKPLHKNLIFGIGTVDDVESMKY